MIQANEDVLKSILQELKQEKETVNNLIRDNLDKISEIEYYKKSLIGEEDKDFRIFSPRDAESRFKFEVEQDEFIINQCKKQNIDYNLTLISLNSRISKMEEIIRSESESITYEESVESGFRNRADTARRDVSLTVLNIQEEERQRIARDLHDTSLQNLTHLVHKVELSSMFIDQDTLRAKLELAVVNKNLKSIIDEIRNTIYNLRPMTFDDLGIKEALERLLMTVTEGSKLEVKKDIEDIIYENDLIMMTIYRVIQECLSNTVKHSKGNKLFLSCKNKNKGCEVIIEDNGIGFTIDEVLCKQNKHFGLSVMNERVELLGGKLELKSSPGQGTKVTIFVPCISN